MPGTVKKLQFSEGTDVGAPSDLSLQSGTSTMVTYPDDAAFILGEGAPTDSPFSSAYFNSSNNKFRYYTNGAWHNNLSENDAANITSNTEVRATEGAGTTTLTVLDVRPQMFDLTANHTVKLPTTGIFKGDVWTMSNPNAFTLFVQASDASDITYLYGQEAVLVSLIDTPVSASDWKIRYETFMDANLISRSVVHTGSGSASTNLAIATFSTESEHEGADITYVSDVTLGDTWTINKSGIYAMMHSNLFTSDTQMGISLNASQLSTNIEGINTPDALVICTAFGNDNSAACAVTRHLEAGDIIRAHAAANFVNAADFQRSRFTIQRVS